MRKYFGLFLFVVLICSLFTAVSAESDDGECRLESLEQSFFVSNDVSSKVKIVYGESAADEDLECAERIFDILRCISLEKMWMVTSPREYDDIVKSECLVEDSSVTIWDKQTYNLVLVGGPLANDMVWELMEKGMTSMEYWTSSYGDVVVFSDAYSKGLDVIVVAGKDRLATQNATSTFLGIPMISEYTMYVGEKIMCGRHVIENIGVNIYSNECLLQIDGENILFSVNPFSIESTSIPDDVVYNDTFEVGNGVVNVRRIMIGSGGSYLIKLSYSSPIDIDYYINETTVEKFIVESECKIQFINANRVTLFETAIDCNSQSLSFTLDDSQYVLQLPGYKLADGVEKEYSSMIRGNGYVMELFDIVCGEQDALPYAILNVICRNKTLKDENTP